jgi:hypothetical protein
VLDAMLDNGILCSNDALRDGGILSSYDALEDDGSLTPNGSLLRGRYAGAQRRVVHKRFPTTIRRTLC